MYSKESILEVISAYLKVADLKYDHKARYLTLDEMRFEEGYLEGVEDLASAIKDVLQDDN